MTLDRTDPPCVEGENGRMIGPEVFNGENPATSGRVAVRSRPGPLMTPLDYNMFVFEGHDGSYCEECLRPLTKIELKRNAFRTGPAECDLCTIKHETTEGWDLDLLKVCQ